jgi:hypothetical protein
VRTEGLCQWKIPLAPSGIIRVLPACSAVTQSTAPPRAPNWVSVVNIASRLRTGQTGIRIPGEAREYSILRLWGPESLLLNWYRGGGALSLRIRWPERKTDHWPTSSAQLYFHAPNIPSRCAEEVSAYLNVPDAFPGASSPQRKESEWAPKPIGTWWDKSLYRSKNLTPIYRSSGTRRPMTMLSALLKSKIQVSVLTLGLTQKH